MVRYVLILFIIILISCQNDFNPEPIKKVKVDYSFRISQNYEGMVKFSNASACVSNFEWRFGFYEGNQEKLSNLPAPTIIFPSNGSYNVILSAQDSAGKLYVTEKIVEVNNY